jgi:hypothetical protein
MRGKLFYAARMEPTVKRKAVPLIRAVIVLQLKLLLGAGRDLVLMPIALVAAALDLVRLKQQGESLHFRQVLMIGEKTDRWIDVWYANHDQQAEPRENVDALLVRVEEVVRNRDEGARQARVLKRWAERQIQRAKQHAAERNRD